MEDRMISDMTEEDRERARRRRERAARMRREKQKRLRMQRMVVLGTPVAAFLLLLVFTVVIVGNVKKAKAFGNRGTGTVISAEKGSGTSGQTGSDRVDGAGGNIGEVYGVVGDESKVNLSGGSGNEAFSGAGSSIGNEGSSGDGETPYREPTHYSAQTSAATVAPPGEVDSTNVILIDMETERILAQRGYQEPINPASMTKVLTVLVAAEQVTDLDDKFTITIDITDYSYSNDCSSVGFSVGETVTVRDLFYGTILPSGADAAVALATYVAGSQEAFVDKMNEKAEELGIADTAHFTNCVGLYDKQHFCTVYDMAIIMEAAMDNALCREVMNARTYTTTATTQHPEGITVSNWFLRRIEDKDTHGEVLCAKTGYVVQSGNCAVSYAEDKGGHHYVCVTTGAHSSWRCIYDHVAIYEEFLPETEGENLMRKLA